MRRHQSSSEGHRAVHRTKEGDRRHVWIALAHGPRTHSLQTGTDVGVVKDGKLTALYVFIDPPSQR